MLSRSLAVTPLRRMAASASVQAVRQQSTTAAEPPVYRGIYTIGRPVREIQMPTEPGLIERWGGWLPVSGMLGAALVSKEILLLDPELLLGSISLTAMMIYYLAIGNTAAEFFKERAAKEKELWDDANDMLLTLLTQYKNAQKTRLDTPEVLRQYAKEYSDALKKHATAMTLRPQLAAREKLVTTLNALKNREKTQQAEAQSKLVDEIVKSVTEQWKKTPQLKDELFELALASWTQAKTDKKNPVFRTVLDRLAQAK